MIAELDSGLSREEI